MPLVRVIRPLPIKLTAERLRKLMNQYGLSRRVTARLMRSSASTVDRYRDGTLAIPVARAELLLFKLNAIYSQDGEPIEIPF